MSLIEHFLRFMAGPVLVVSTPCGFTSTTGPSFFPDVSPFFDLFHPLVMVANSSPGEGLGLISKANGT